MFTTSFSCSSVLVVLGATRFALLQVPAAFLQAVKRAGYEVDHSPSSSAEIKNGSRLYGHSWTDAFMVGRGITVPFLLVLL